MARLPRPDSNFLSALARSGAGGGLWRWVAAGVGGLAAGAASAHLLHTRGDKLARNLGIELGTRRYEPDAADPTPEDYDAREPGRGRLAAHPGRIPGAGWFDILWRTGGAYLGDRVGFVAGGVTFFMILSLFPMLAAFVTIYGLFADPGDAWGRLQFLYSVLPDNVAEFIGAQMQRLAENSRGQLTFTLIWTLALSLWTANNGVKHLFYGLNVAYSEAEKRNFIKYNLVCMAFTVTALLAVLMAAALVIGVPVVLAVLGLEDEWAHLAPLRWPLLFAGYVFALVLIYRFGPCRATARWRWLTVGAVTAAALSLIVSLLFSFFLNNFVRTDTYGPLAAMMGFLLWTWITVQIVLMGAELNAEIEHQTALDTTVGAPRPMGERGAIMADTLGARRGNPAALAFTLRHAEALSDRLRRRGRHRDE
ncbi:MAG: YihY/virulence factor BrkB family protein [Brevundimonas sp.]|uniref:YihY/virulence factor BrkB family protein n=1 Tax=Brevundimonas sp. TaxID=1871086 RepID=UPI00391CD384